MNFFNLHLGACRNFLTLFKEQKAIQHKTNEFGLHNCYFQTLTGNCAVPEPLYNVRSSHLQTPSQPSLKSTHNESRVYIIFFTETSKLEKPERIPFCATHTHTSHILPVHTQLTPPSHPPNTCTQIHKRPNMPDKKQKKISKAHTSNYNQQVCHPNLQSQ